MRDVSIFSEENRAGITIEKKKRDEHNDVNGREEKLNERIDDYVKTFKSIEADCTRRSRFLSPLLIGIPILAYTENVIRAAGVAWEKREEFR